MVGGPGLGKTTLMTQAIAENRLAPRGDDIWLGVEPADADGDTLARDVAAVLARRSSMGGPAADDASDLGRTPAAEDTVPDPDPGAVADAMWRRAPTPVCIVFDDVHAVPPRRRGPRG